MNSSSRPTDIRNVAISIPEAEKMLWGAGNMALADKNVSQKRVMGEELGKMFDIVSQARAAAVAAHDSPAHQISIGQLLHDVDSQADAVYDQKAERDQLGVVNVFDIRDDRLPALEGLRLYVEASYHDLRHDQTTSN